MKMKTKEFLRVAGGMFCMVVGAIVIAKGLGEWVPMISGAAFIAVGLALLIAE